MNSAPRHEDDGEDDRDDTLGALAAAAFEEHEGSSHAGRRSATAQERERIESLLRQYWVDRKAGQARTLEDYLSMFPGDARTIAREYLALEEGSGLGHPGPHRLQAGDHLGPYRVIRELGRGGQGSVYLAEDSKLQRKVALKLLTGLGPQADGELKRFWREVEVASKLEHPGVCGIYDAGVIEGVAYIAMRYVEGETLARKIAASREREGGSRAGQSAPLPEGEPDSQAGSTSGRSRTRTTTVTRQAVIELLAIFEKVARSLHVAHEAGIIHRDIKPGNIMITPSGEPVILDFGLARDQDTPATLTRSGELFGTPAYMSPEQLTAQKLRMDRRTDVWALGVSLYESLTLCRPFEAPTRQGLYQAITSANPPDPRRRNRAIPPDLKVVLETALQKDRDHRYQTAEALADDLKAVREGLPIRARRPGPLGRLARWGKREPAKAALLAVVLVSLPTIATLVTFHLANQPRVEAARLLEIERQKDELLAKGHFELGHGHPDRSISSFERARRMEGRSPAALVGLVLARLRLKQPEEALRFLDLLDAEPDTEAVMAQLRIDVLRDLGQQEEAERLLKVTPTVRTSESHHLLAVRALGNCKSASNADHQEALAHATAAILLSPTPRFSLYLLRMHAAVHLRNREVILEMASSMQALWPRSAIVWHLSSLAFGALGDPTVVEDWIAAAHENIRLDPTSAEAHSVLGMALAQKGSYDDAIAAQRAAIRLQPDLALAHEKLAYALHRKGQCADAIVEYRAALRLDVTLWAAQTNLAMCTFEQGRPDEAIAESHKALEIAPSDKAYDVIGQALMAKGLLDEAIAAFRKAILLPPTSADAPFHFSLALCRKGLFDEAISMARQAILIEPGSADVHFNLGSILLNSDLPGEASASFRNVIRIAPGYAEAHCNLGHALREQGFITEALAELRKGHELGSQHADWAYPSADWVAACERLLPLEEAFEAALRGADPPENPSELRQFAGMAKGRRRYVAAATWYRKLLEMQPQRPQQIVDRHAAAAAAILAAAGADSGCGSLGAEAQRAWRAEALAWLRENLRMYRGRAEAGLMSEETLAKEIERWKHDPDLASVRGQDALGGLPEAERQAWRAFWSEVDALLKTLQ